MHLLLAQKGVINEGDEAVDLDQKPADVIFLSAADTEISALALSCRSSNLDFRLANLMQLSHPMSVDVYCEKTIAKSKLVIVRLLGGVSYWPYGLERLQGVCAQNGVTLIVLPGSDKPDPELDRFCNINGFLPHKLHEYFNHGGPSNMKLVVAYCDYLLGNGDEPGDAVPLLKAGIWRPEIGISDENSLLQYWRIDAPIAAICFYRALVQSGGFQPIEMLIDALEKHGFNVLPLFISSLKDPISIATLRQIFKNNSPQIVINLTGFAASSPDGANHSTVLDETGAVVLQAILASGSLEDWESSPQGLSSRDLAMNIALPEVDGRILSRAIAFKNADKYDAKFQTNIVWHQGVDDRVAFVADLASNWSRLRNTPANKRRVALILANYPNRDGRLGNGVGLDTPAGTLEVLKALEEHGYFADGFPDDSAALIDLLQSGVTNATTKSREIRQVLLLNNYLKFFDELPEKIQVAINSRWGSPKDDPFFVDAKNGFALPLVQFGNVVVAIQPARGYNIDPKETYHSPDLVPPHGYLALYAWLRGEFDTNAIVHMGKHGNLEWLPGKALSLSKTCYPEAILGPMPHLYPFIVNDPGEGSQAKRRTSAVIIDHLTPPLTRAENYGPLRDLEALVDEYYEASGNDPRRLVLLKKQILELMGDISLDVDAGIGADDDTQMRLEKLDAYLCDLKEMQIRDGLHIFGISPEGRLKHDLAVALVRVARNIGKDGDQSLHRAIANDLRLEFDPLDCEMEKPWQGKQPEILASICNDNWRIVGDTVERVELLASAFVSRQLEIPDNMAQTKLVMAQLIDKVIPDIEACGSAEIGGLLAGLNGRFVAPGPSGAPTRGRGDVLPTGRNFYSLDSRSVPTSAAWELGKKSAELLITRYRQDHGEWPTSFGLSAWGTSNMRTGGDDIAQMLALIGAKPQWDHASRRVTGYEIITLAQLGRPRVDVTLRISGFFRDAFPVQIELLDKAIRAIGALDEDAKDNPIAERMGNEKSKLLASGIDDVAALRKSGFRIFGSKPNSYGAGLQALIDEKGWQERADFGESYLEWGSYAYGEKEDGARERGALELRLGEVEAVIHNQDNREHDLLDSDDYYQFEGGMSSAIEKVSGTKPKVYHNDHSRPERPVIRALEDEIARVVRGRAANPKWIAGVMRHGYKGAFEMAATLDYMFAFSATTGAVRNHHFDLVYAAWIDDENVAAFLRDNNPAALQEMGLRFLEAIERGLWTPRSNSARIKLQQLNNPTNDGTKHG